MWSEFIVFLGLAIVAGGRRPGSLPLGAEETPKKSSKAAECLLGDEVRELGSSWFADLGPPFGVMYCVKCQCVPVQKKKRVVGKIHCRNIKHECPKPSCEEPVLAPGQCCKLCPEDLSATQGLDEAVSPPDEDDRSLKYFANVMTGSETATGRYSFHKRSLYYSFYATSRPQSVQFLDENGSILEEQDLGPGSAYQNSTGKICGVWRRIPRDYRKMIREEKLSVGLVWADKTPAVGQLVRHRTLQTEMYSSLLTPSHGLDGGGTAIVSVSTTSPSIHITILFSGRIFNREDSKEAPVTVHLATEDGHTVVIDETVRVKKASPDLNTVEVSSAVSGSALRLLSWNRLRLSLESRTSGRRIEGLITPRAVCETFQSLMKPHDEESTDQSSGLAWIFVDKNGRLDYHVKIDRVTRPVVIGLVTERKLVELEDLSPELTSNGWTNGTLEPPTPKYLEMLYAGELGVNVATQNSNSVVRGRLTAKYVASPIDTEAPVLLTNEGLTDTRLSALAWIDVDLECNLHFEVEVSRDGDYALYVSERPMDVPGAPETRKLLSSGGSHIEGSNLSLLPRELASLANHVVRVELQGSHGEPLLKGNWLGTRVPDGCLPHHSIANDLDRGFHNDGPVDEIVDPLMENRPGPCFHGGKYHEEGSQWRSTTEPCYVCQCHNGRLKCEPLICPALPDTCTPLLPKGPDQCCPTCHNETFDNVSLSDELRGCHMAGQFFPPGSSWHPYLPPNGFDTCTVCSCNALTLELTCPRVVCPPLNCDHRVAVSLHKQCCKVCPSSLPTSGSIGHLSEMQGEEGVTDSPESQARAILADGGCLYPVGGPYRNGEQWHPRLYSHGEVKCVKCRCKDGDVKCERKRCTKHSCNDECCAATCKRRRRNIRRHH